MPIKAVTFELIIVRVPVTEQPVVFIIEKGKINGTIAPIRANLSSSSSSIQSSWQYFLPFFVPPPLPLNSLQTALYENSNRKAASTSRKYISERYTIPLSSFSPCTTIAYPPTTPTIIADITSRVSKAKSGFAKFAIERKLGTAIRAQLLQPSSLATIIQKQKHQQQQLKGSSEAVALAPHQTNGTTLVEQQKSVIETETPPAASIMELVAPNDHSPLTQLNQSMESVNNLSDEEVGAHFLPFIVFLN